MGKPRPKQDDATKHKDPPYPTMKEVVTAMTGEDLDSEGPIRHLSIRVLDTREVIYKLHPRNGKDVTGGVIRV
jgi:hypothetical protein